MKYGALLDQKQSNENYVYNSNSVYEGNALLMPKIAQAMEQTKVGPSSASDDLSSALDGLRFAFAQSTWARIIDWQAQAGKRGE